MYIYIHVHVYICICIHYNCIALRCEVWGSHGGEVAHVDLMDCDALWTWRWVLLFRWNILPHLQLKTAVPSKSWYPPTSSHCVTTQWASRCLLLHEYCVCTGLFKKKYTFQKFILRVLLNIWRLAIYRLKGELLKLFSHLTWTRCEPHV
jgi:hypothetical protein